MQFLLDMGISPRTAEHLRARGHEALHLREENLERLADPDILQKARREGRILLAHDLDFGVRPKSTSSLRSGRCLPPAGQRCPASSRFGSTTCARPASTVTCNGCSMSTARRCKEGPYSA